MSAQLRSEPEVKSFSVVLFDLDGTLVDSLPDIADAMNAALKLSGLRTLDPALIGSFVGKGPRVLAQRILGEQPQLNVAERAGLTDSLLASYVHLYADQIGQRGTIFPGVADCLHELRARGLKLGVVSNALHHLAEAILARFAISPFFDVVLGGDSVANNKPHPEPLLHALRILGAAPDEALMVGDSINDVAAARAAGCDIVCVPHGYHEGNAISDLNCDIVENFTLLPSWIAARRLRPRFAAQSR